MNEFFYEEAQKNSTEMEIKTSTRPDWTTHAARLRERKEMDCSKLYQMWKSNQTVISQ